MEKHNLEVLIASLNKDEKIYNDSNLKTNAIIANQCDKSSVVKSDKLTIVNTQTRGVGINRNIALLYANSDYVLFGDDDLKYVDNLEEIVISEFKRNPKADGLIFNIITKGSDVHRRRQNNKIKRVRYYNFMNYGTVRLAFKLDKIKKNNIWFTTMFGGGTNFSCGEDTTFIADCLKHGLKIYTAPVTICTVDQSTSTWFDGFNEKYFIDKGALLYSIFPKVFCILKYIFAFKMRSKNIPFFKLVKLMNEGKKVWKNI